jgi:hypothetical protein
LRAGQVFLSDDVGEHGWAQPVGERGVIAGRLDVYLTGKKVSHCVSLDEFAGNCIAMLLAIASRQGSNWREGDFP